MQLSSTKIAPPPGRRTYTQCIVASQNTPYIIDYPSSNHSPLLRSPQAKKTKTNDANSKRRAESDSGGIPSGTETDTSSPRPIVLERRKNPNYSAAAEHQLRELQDLAHRLIQEREQEQQTLSRELHDNIAQVLSAVTTRLTLAKNESMPAWLRQELLGLREHVQNALADVRTLALELRPAAFDHSSFADALAKQADAFRQRTRLNLEFRVVPEACSFLGNGELTHLFRLTREAMQNIEEHSRAENALIDIRRNNGALHLEIRDDGCGFTTDRVIQAQQNGHLGLLGMRERAELLGGTFFLDAVPDQGTVIRVTIPLPEKHPNPKRSGTPDYQI
jgi:signal transduction histidine kinase